MALGKLGRQRLISLLPLGVRQELINQIDRPLVAGHIAFLQPVSRSFDVIIHAEPEFRPKFTDPLHTAEREPQLAVCLLLIPSQQLLGAVVRTLMQD